MASWQMHGIALVLRLTRRPVLASAERFGRRMQRPKRETPPPRRLRRRHQVTERAVEGFPVWTVRPQGGSGPTAVYLHGGAYTAGIAPQHWALVGRLADAGVRVEVPLYGLAPPHTHRDAYPFLRRLWAELVDRTPGELVLAGDSAGGGLALGLAQELIGDGDRGPDRLVLLSPWLDLTLSNPRLPEYERRDPWLARAGLHEAARAWAGGDDPTAPRLSPINGEPSGLPPTVLLVGTREIGHPDAVTFAEAAATAGVEIDLLVADGAVHVYPLVPAPEGAEGMRSVVAAVTGRPQAEPVSDRGAGPGRRGGRSP
jgi:monoterpene epsilon-lactone hydrolase